MTTNRPLRVNDVAKQLNVSPSAVRNYANQGKIHYTTNPAGQRIFTQEDIDKYLGKTPIPKYAYYARSSSGDKQLIQSQINELTQKYGEPVAIYTDSASGLNENRKGLQRLLDHASTGEFNTVVITYRDRLSRFGVNYLIQLLAKDGIRLIIANENKNYSLEEELLRDFMMILSSFSGKFHRLRSKQAQKQLLAQAMEELDA